MKKYKAVFLDLDDTIWNFYTNAKKSLRTIFYDIKLDEHYADFEEFYQVYSKNNLKLWTQYGQGLITKEYLSLQRFLHPLTHIGLENEDLALQISKDFLDLLAVQTDLMPYALELLEHCKKQNLPVTIISNGFREVQYQKMESAKIDHYFEHVVLSEDVGALKPDSLIFEYALQINRLQPNEVLMIGDSFDADIIGANRAGIDSLFFNIRNQIVDLPPNSHEIKSLQEVISYV